MPAIDRDDVGGEVEVVEQAVVHAVIVPQQRGADPVTGHRDQFGLEAADLGRGEAAGDDDPDLGEPAPIEGIAQPAHQLGIDAGESSRPAPPPHRRAPHRPVIARIHAHPGERAGPNVSCMARATASESRSTSLS
jgi:hypothetical protein